MPRLRLGKSVFSAAKERIAILMRSGHKVVVTFSGGKDSTVCLELALMAARETGYGDVDVAVQDEEIAYPGTYEFIERTAQRKGVRLHWYVMQQPMLNVFNRFDPYWWVCDPLLNPSDWVREPPKWAKFVADKNLYFMVNPLRFPVARDTSPGEVWDPADTTQRLCAVIGLRASESAKRLLGLFSSGGYISAANEAGVHLVRPIYDWGDGDVWKFISDLKLDYNKAYDVLYKMGAPKYQLRVGPPTMTRGGIKGLDIASRAWPNWFDRVATRVPGIRTAVQFGERAVMPYRRYGETWEACFRRECLSADVPEWLRSRARLVADHAVAGHERHSTQAFPEIDGCRLCGVLGSWKMVARVMWGGDPYGQGAPSVLKCVEPEFFRPGAGTWGGEWAKGKNVKINF